MRVVRKVVFSIFVLLYLITCPLVMLYAFGYVFKPGVEQGIVKTGLIDLSTTPPGASVYLGHRRYTKRTPTLLRNLLPGEYPVRLVLKSYQPWERIVPVQAEKATVLDKILLLPQTFKREELLAERFDGLIPLPATHFFLLTKGPRVEDHLVYNWKDHKRWPLLPADSPFATARVLSYDIVRGSPSLLLHVDAREGQRFLWIERVGEAPRVHDLTNLLPAPPFHVDWEPVERKHLWTSQQGAVSRVDITSRTISPKLIEGVRGYGLFEKAIYVLRETGRLERMDYEGETEAVLLDDPALLHSLFGDREGFQIHVPANDVLLFIGERGGLLAGRLPYRFVEKGVLGFDWHPHRAALIWRKDRLGVLEFTREPTGEDLVGPVPEFHWLFTRGSDIEQAFWVYEGTHVIFRDGDRVFLLEREADRPPRPIELLQIQRDSSVMYADESGTLYYLDRATGRPSAIEILPRWEFLAFEPR